ncbi:hypothetical protein LX36DRAFT_339013 [Colletotrichum falcatum]|nr:hypothetical protein LX36DRAFT_339013 [Colletotrichum falcatum]
MPSLLPLPLRFAASSPQVPPASCTPPTQSISSPARSEHPNPAQARTLLLTRQVPTYVDMVQDGGHPRRYCSDWPMRGEQASTTLSPDRGLSIR